MTPANEASETAKLVELARYIATIVRFEGSCRAIMKEWSGTIMQAAKSLEVEIERLQASLAARDEEKVVWREPPEGYGSWEDYFANPPPPTEALKELFRKYRANQALANVTDSQEARMAGMEEAAKEWPIACIKRASCARHSQCMYGRFGGNCPHYGRDIAAAIRATAQKEGG